MEAVYCILSSSEVPILSVGTGHLYAFRRAGRSGARTGVRKGLEGKKKGQPGILAPPWLRFLLFTLFQCLKFRSFIINMYELLTY